MNQVRRQQPSLAEAAALGCKKCKTELDTGEKSRRVHADSCPRKRGYVEQDACGKIDDMVTLSETSMKQVRRQHTSLAEAAALGCKKCKTELDTGEKSRRVHADSCPRKRGYVEQDGEGMALRSTRLSLRSKFMNAEVYDEESWSEDEDEGSDTQAKRLWSSEEDIELVKQVSKHGTSWATILTESSIIAKRYAGASSGTYCCLIIV